METIDSAVTHLLGLLKGSHPHIGNFYPYPILLFVMVVLASHWKSIPSVRKYLYTFVTLLLLIYLGSICSLLPIPFFKSYNMSRLFFFYPTVCYILVAKTFAIIAKHQDKKRNLLLVTFVLLIVTLLLYTVKIAVALLFLFGVLWLLMNNHSKYLAVGSAVCVMVFFSVITSNIELVNNISRLANVKSDSNPSFRQYYDEKLFKIIKKDLKTDDHFTCKVVSLGMQPAIAEYNGFYTIDSYIVSYSLDFKKEFRKVIEKELEKGNDYIQHFDQYGVRCYLFASELEYKHAHIYSKDDKKKVNHLEINTDELKQLGCQYILSAVDL